MTDTIPMQDIDTAPQTQDLLTLGELKAFIDEAIANGSSEATPVYNTVLKVFQ